MSVGKPLYQNPVLHEFEAVVSRNAYYFAPVSRNLLATAYIFSNLIDKICSCKFILEWYQIKLFTCHLNFFLRAEFEHYPLYTFSVIFSKSPIDGNEDILGALSIVLYTLILFPLLKYVLVWLWWIVVISMNWSIYCVLRKGFDSLVKFWSWLVLNLTSHVWAADL